MLSYVSSIALPFTANGLYFAYFLRMLKQIIEGGLLWVGIRSRKSDKINPSLAAEKFPFASSSTHLVHSFISAPTTHTMITPQVRYYSLTTVPWIRVLLSPLHSLTHVLRSVLSLVFIFCHSMASASSSARRSTRPTQQPLSLADEQAADVLSRFEQEMSPLRFVCP